jgi:hypothetical protein
MDKEKRCELANELIMLIANEGRKFFNHENTNYRDEEGCISHFAIKNGYIYFVDGYTHRNIYVYRYRNFKRWFSEGGTLQALVMDLVEYIRLGTSANGTNGYGGVYCQHWGYPKESMKVIQQKAIEIGFSKTIVEDLRNYI